MHQQERLKADRQTAASVATEIAALAKMTIGELREKFHEVLGFPSRSGNGVYLRKRLSWQLQANAEGGLSQRALDRIEELAPLAPVRWRPILTPATAAAAPSRTSPPVAKARDPRLPPPGTVLVRTHGGIEHRVTILDDGFAYQGQSYRSLSRIARVIAGTPWNGLLFFHLRTRSQPPQPSGELR